MSKELIPSYEGELPENWTISTIGKLITSDGIFIDGDWVESKDQDPNGDVRLIQLADIGDGEYKNKSSRFLTKLKAIELKCTFLKSGDILLARMPDPLGRACIFPGDSKECVTVVDVCVIRTDIANHKWLMYWLNSPKLRNTIASLQSGTTRRRISRGNLASITFPVPPPDQQKQIVAKVEELFSHIDAGVVALQKAKQLLKQYRQSVLKAAVTGELTREWRERNKDDAHGSANVAGGRTPGATKLEPASELLKRILAERRSKWEEQQFQKFKENGKLPKNDKWKESFQEPYNEYEAFCDIPETWCWATIDQLGDVQLGRQRSPKNRSDKYPTKYIRAANITENGLDLNDLLDMEFKPDEFERYMMKENDLVLSEASGSSDQVGKPAIWRKNMPTCCFQNTVIRHRVYGLDAEYILIHYKYFYWCQVFSKTAGGVGINHLSAQKFSKLSISLPPLNEQNIIAQKVDHRLNTADRLEKEIDAKLTKSDRFKQSILAAAFSGKLQ